MTFTWPLALLSLLLVPLLIGAHILQRRRRRRVAVNFSSVALIKAAMPGRSRWRRHIPAALLLAAIATLGVGAARPEASTNVSVARTSIILALDVSRSMCATDVSPNRLSVAQDAARAFVKAQPSGTRIGIVAFAGFAELVVPPTTKRQDLIDAIDRLTTSRGTVIGAATLKSLDAIAAINPDVAPIGVELETAASGPERLPGSVTAPDTGVATPDTTAAPTPPKGGYIPDIVVLLTDGANTRGIEPLDAAKFAADRRVRVYTIGFGTTNPTGAMVCTPEQMGGETFGGGPPGGLPPGFGGGTGLGGRRGFLVIDEPTLRGVAKLTGGTFYKAEDAAQLKSVFKELPKQVATQKRHVELSVVFVAFGALLACAAMVLSLLWNRN